MGDSGNIVVRSGQGYDDVWLYTHWDGSEMKDVLQTVLSRKERWNDAPYLARMIFSAMVRNNINGESGYGISTYMCDNNHGILVVDVLKEKVVRIQEADLIENRLPLVLDYRVSRTFTEFAANGFKGKKKRAERRIGELSDRRVIGYSLVSGQSRDRFSYGRRKDD